MSEWECFPFGESTEPSQEPSCSVVSESMGTRAPTARFEMPKDAEADFGGIALCAAMTDEAMALSGFERLAFEAQLEPVTERVPTDVRVWLELGCRELPAKHPLVRAEFFPSADVRSFELQLSEFREVDVATDGFLEECLARIDEVCAVVDRSTTELVSAQITLDRLVLH